MKVKKGGDQKAGYMPCMQVAERQCRVDHLSVQLSLPSTVPIVCSAGCPVDQQCDDEGLEDRSQPDVLRAYKWEMGMGRRSGMDVGCQGVQVRLDQRCTPQAALAHQVRSGDAVCCQPTMPVPEGGQQAHAQQWTKAEAEAIRGAAISMEDGRDTHVPCSCVAAHPATATISTQVTEWYAMDKPTGLEARSTAAISTPSQALPNNDRTPVAVATLYPPPYRARPHTLPTATLDGRWRERE